MFLQRYEQLENIPSKISINPVFTKSSIFPPQVTNKIKLQASCTFKSIQPSSSNYHSLFLEGEYLNEENCSIFEKTLGRKIQVCNIICDFSPEKYNLDLISMKEKALKTIQQYVQYTRSMINLSKDTVFSLFEMCIINFSRKIQILNWIIYFWDMIPNISEPAMQHLKYVYPIFSKLFQCFPNLPFINFPFIETIFSVLESSDILEQELFFQLVLKLVKIRSEMAENVFQKLISVLESYREGFYQPVIIFKFSNCLLIFIFPLLHIKRCLPSLTVSYLYFLILFFHFIAKSSQS
jgi:hypothetical protein